MVKLCICEDTDAISRMRELVERAKGYIADEHRSPKQNGVSFYFDYNTMAKHGKIIKQNRLDAVCFILPSDIPKVDKVMHKHMKHVRYDDHQWINPNELRKEEEFLCKSSSKDSRKLMLVESLDRLGLT